RVSVIVPARNEELHLESALQSLLALDYENLEITVVDDRSTDRTGEILDRMAESNPQLRVVHLQQLPPKWLGKNYAMHCGAEDSNGEWLLFTDADVMFEASVLRRAMGYVRQQQLDHLAIVPEACMPTWLLQSFIVVFAIFFSLFTRLWKVRDPRSSAHVGIGAFNLVRAEAYRQVGGHEPLAMRPDDDLKLGKLLKKNGFRQDLLKGVDLLRVPWYGSLRELIVGLEKNSFAGVEYNVLVTVVAVSAILLLDVSPFVALCFTTGATWWIYLAVSAILLLLAWGTAIGAKIRWSCALGFPWVTVLFVYIVLRSMVVTLKNGGIRWRDTHYPLADLRANKV
ncbi:MAG: glycosyltransferase, partial [Planctomycetota bacterium]|nr:glycosyltransferase [Planctomycetota bacterium]